MRKSLKGVMVRNLDSSFRRSSSREFRHQISITLAIVWKEAS